MLNVFFTVVTRTDMPLPVGSPKMAAWFLKKNLPSFAWNTLRLLENNPVSLADTKLIIDGWAVSGLRISDLLQVKHFADAAKLLAGDIGADNFAISLEQLRKIHSNAGKEEVLEWGVLRTSHVYVGDCAYIPPDSQKLPDIINSGMGELETLAQDSPLDAAINAFAFLSKTQPFFDANKRTAMLFANGILMSNGLYPLFIPASLTEVTNTAITSLYEDGDASKLLDVFTNSCSIFYLVNIDYGHRYKLEE